MRDLSGSRKILPRKIFEKIFLVFFPSRFCVWPYRKGLGSKKNPLSKPVKWAKFGRAKILKYKAPKVGPKSGNSTKKYHFFVILTSFRASYSMFGPHTLKKTLSGMPRAIFFIFACIKLPTQDPKTKKRNPFLCTLYRGTLYSSTAHWFLRGGTNNV